MEKQIQKHTNTETVPMLMQLNTQKESEAGTEEERRERMRGGERGREERERLRGGEAGKERKRGEID